MKLKKTKNIKHFNSIKKLEETHQVQHKFDLQIISEVVCPIGNCTSILIQGIKNKT